MVVDDNETVMSGRDNDGRRLVGLGSHFAIDSRCELMEAGGEMKVSGGEVMVLGF